MDQIFTYSAQIKPQMTVHDTTRYHTLLLYIIMYMILMHTELDAMLANGHLSLDTISFFLLSDGIDETNYIVLYLIKYFIKIHHKFNKTNFQLNCLRCEI